MACLPSELIDTYKCLIQGLSPHQALSSWAHVLCSGPPEPPAEDTRITEEGDTRVTEEGDTRIIE